MNAAPRPLERPVEATISWQSFCNAVIAPDAQSWHTYPVRTEGRTGGENTVVALHKTKKIGLRIIDKNPAPDGRVLVSWIDSLFDDIDVLTIAVEANMLDNRAIQTANAMIQDWETSSPEMEESDDSCTQIDFDIV